MVQVDIRNEQLVSSEAEKEMIKNRNNQIPHSAQDNKREKGTQTSMTTSRIKVPPHDKTNKMTVRPAETLIRVLAVRSMSS